ncbi:hypothetical protein DKM19_20870 [Streptosporangium sp. 'caverna']|nr:hypothetical protein DKM19_20870 [Streptosporangium sp. 'caverna']
MSVPAGVVLDMHAAPTTADVLLTPPVSPQLAATGSRLRRRPRLCRNPGPVVAGPGSVVLRAGAVSRGRAGWPPRPR